MATKRTRRRAMATTRSVRKTKADLEGDVLRLGRRVRRLERALEAAHARLEEEVGAERERARRKVEAVRRGADRRLSGMMREIATLRHHEARAAALERLLAERTSDDVPQP